MTRSDFKKAIIIIIAIVIVIAISAGMATIIHNKVGIPASVTVTNGLSAYELAAENGYTGTVQEWLDSLGGKSAYEIAAEHGYTGTEEEWTSALTQLAESDIQTIKSASFNENEQLILNIGNAFGIKGADGKDGVDGKDGDNGQDGLDGKDGINGKDGIDGVSITDVDINDAGELVLAFSDKKSVNLGKVVGASGIQGPKGDKGDKGVKGDTGAQGPQGEKGETGAGIHCGKQ